jgi:hypothetical protein
MFAVACVSAKVRLELHRCLNIWPYCGTCTRVPVLSIWLQLQPFVSFLCVLYLRWASTIPACLEYASLACEELLAFLKN